MIISPLIYIIPSLMAIVAGFYAALVWYGIHNEQCDICPLHRDSVSVVAAFIMFMSMVYVTAQAMWFVREFGAALGWHDVLWATIETSYLGVVSWYTRKVHIIFCRDYDASGKGARHVADVR